MSFPSWPRTTLFLALQFALIVGDAQAACVPPPSDLVGWWRAEGNGIDSANGNHGTVGTTGFTAGEVGQGFDFLPPSGVTIPSSPSYNPQSPGFTAEFWMQAIHNQPDGDATLFEKSHGGNSGWAFQLNSTPGNMRFAMGNGSSFVEISAAGDVLDGVFHHIAGTWDGSTLRLYVDGVLKSSAAITTPAGNSGTLNVGYWWAGARRFRGIIDEPSIYARALSLSELQSIVAAGSDGKCTSCGDSVVDFDETCDDGNVVAGDCCSAACLFESNGSACATDGNACTDDQCDGAGTCTHPNNVAPCDDGLFCNGVDTCAGGICTHPGDPCAGGPECDDACDEGADTCAEPFGTPCASDGSVCSLDACDGAGACAHTPTNAGVECRASAGVCDPAELCDGANVACGADAKSVAPCRAAAGDCDAAEVCDGVADDCPADLALPDGTGCDDANGCTITDQCLAGACTGNPMTCGDGTVQGGCAEECDDGNLVPEDGCNATCQLEPCGPTPAVGCRQPTVSGKAQLKLKDTDDAKDQLQWKWGSGAATTLAELGDPTTTESYYLCLYDAGVLRSSTQIPAGGMCSGKPCWKAGTHGFQYKSKELLPDGTAQLKLKEGIAGKAQIQIKAKGVNLEMPALGGALIGPVTVQLKQASEAVCWEAIYSVPFSKNDGTSFGDKSD